MTETELNIIGFRMQLYYLLVVVVVSDIKVMSFPVTVIFAIGCVPKVFIRSLGRDCRDHSD